MEKQEYLSEEKYKNVANKLKKIGKILLIIGITILVVGTTLLIFGAFGFGKTLLENMSSNGSDFESIFGNIGIFAIGSLVEGFGFVLSAIGGVLLVIAHKREITAFQVQQVMPIGQEGIDKMTPTVAKSAGQIAKEIKKGISSADEE